MVESGYRSENRIAIRLPYDKSLQFKICSPNFVSEMHLASSRNVSQTGLCFRANSSPPLGSIIKIDTDLPTLARCIQVENMIFELDGGILGKVVWTQDAAGQTGKVDVGVAFIRIGESQSDEVKEAELLLSV